MVLRDSSRKSIDSKPLNISARDRNRSNAAAQQLLLLHKATRPEAYAAHIAYATYAAAQASQTFPLSPQKSYAEPLLSTRTTSLHGKPRIGPPLKKLSS